MKKKKVRRVHKKKRTKKQSKILKYLSTSFNGGIILSIIFLFITLASNCSSININFLFDIYSRFGYDVNLFGILVGVIAGFITGFAIMFLYSLLSDLIKGKK